MVHTFPYCCLYKREFGLGAVGGGFSQHLKLSDQDQMFKILNQFLIFD